MRTHVVTGAAGGVGTAIRKYMEDIGDKVIGVDLKGSDVDADLSTDEGRRAMVDEISELCGGKLNGVVANAGIVHREGTPGSLVSSINYFGAVATLENLRPMLAKGDNPRAIVTGSNSMKIIPVFKELMDLYAVGDEAGACKFSDGITHEPGVYGSSKFAMAQWVREKAITPEWIGCGIALSLIAPGLIATPLNTEEEQAAVLDMDDVYPVPARRASSPEEIASLVRYLLSEDAGMICGSVIFMDGGTEAAVAVRRGVSLTPSAWL